MTPPQPNRPFFRPLLIAERLLADTRLQIDTENHLILVKGNVPGAPGGYVVIRKAVAAKPEPQPQLQEKPKKGKK